MEKKSCGIYAKQRFFAMSNHIINSSDSLLKFIGDVRELWNSSKFLRVSIKVGKDRSLDQNAISHVWYSEIAMRLRDDDAQGWKSCCKLHHGVPILRAEDEQFRQFYDVAIKGLTYEQKLQAMKFMPVTSLMTKPQLSKYLEEIQADYLKRGVMLVFPDDEQ